MAFIFYVIHFYTFACDRSPIYFHFVRRCLPFSRISVSILPLAIPLSSLLLLRSVYSCKLCSILTVLFSLPYGTIEFIAHRRLLTVNDYRSHFCASLCHFHGIYNITSTTRTKHNMYCTYEHTLSHFTQLSGRSRFEMQ